MADENKLQFDIELNEGQIKDSFGVFDKEAKNHADEMSAIFKEITKKQEEDTIESQNRIAAERIRLAREFQKETERLEKESQKKALADVKTTQSRPAETLSNALSGAADNQLSYKSAKLSAEAFEAAFAEQLKQEQKKIPPIEIPVAPSAFDILKTQGANLAGAFFLVKTAADQAFNLIKGKIDEVVEGDRLVVLEKSFQTLGASAGISADNIRTKMLEASRGLVDDSALIEAANKAFINLGSNAGRIPEVLDIARRSSKIFGGDISSNFEAINQAIFTGNTRQIRAIGLNINATKVYDDYARKIGTVTALLTEQQKQQALMNEVLEKGSRQFKDVSQAANFSTSLQVLKASMNDLNDEFAKVASSKLGGFFQSIAEGANKAVRFIAEGISKARPVQTVEEATTRIEELRAKIEGFNIQLAAVGKDSGQAFAVNLRREITQAQSDITKFVDFIDNTQQQQAVDLAKGAKQSKIDQSGQNAAELLRRRQELNQKLLETDKILADAQISEAQRVFETNKTTLNLDSLYKQKAAQEEVTYQQQVAETKKFFVNNATATAEQKNYALEELEKAHNLRMEAIEEDRKLKARETALSEVNNLFDSQLIIKKGMEDLALKAKDTTASINVDMALISKSMRAALVENAGKAFAAFGSAMATTGKGAEAFKNAVLGVFGDVLVSLGEGYIKEGAAMALVPGSETRGVQLIAEGAALAAFGGGLKGASGGGGASSSAGGGSAGGAESAGATLTDNTQPDQLKDKVGPTTHVTVQVNGDVFDSTETGLRIAQIIEQNSLSNGLIITGAGA